MSELCRTYGISRKTGYKLRERFEQEGPKGLYDRSRAPQTSSLRTDAAVKKLLLEARRAHPTWGPKKLRAWLLREHQGVKLPAPSTIGDLLKRHQLVQPRKRRRATAKYDAPLQVAKAPNDVWCADFKGQFRLGNGKLCYPLTITDRFSRMILCCEALESTHLEPTLMAFERTFRTYGLPRVIRTDNGTPFAAKSALGLSQLSVRWIRLGVWPERIEPAHPQQNGQHERMHLVLKQETTRPPATTVLAQQDRFDAFCSEYNLDRPHEGIGLRTPASLYVPSPRARGIDLPVLEYPLDDLTALVRTDGRIYFNGARAMLSTALVGERVGLRELDDGAWLVSYAGHVLGHLASASMDFEPSTLLFPRGAERSQPGVDSLRA